MAARAKAQDEVRREVVRAQEALVKAKKSYVDVMGSAGMPMDVDDSLDSEVEPVSTFVSTPKRPHVEVRKQ